MTNLDSILKNRDIANKGASSQSYSLSSSHVWMGGLDYKESWVLKNCYFWTVVLEKTLESPLDSKEIQPVLDPKGNQSWIFIGKTDAEAETPILWPSDAKNRLNGKDPDAGKRLKARGEGDDRGWNGWMASLTWWTWVWVNSRSWWWTEKPGVLLSMGWQRVRHDWATELNWGTKWWKLKTQEVPAFKDLMINQEDNSIFQVLWDRREVFQWDCRDQRKPIRGYHTWVAIWSLPRSYLRT